MPAVMLGDSWIGGPSEPRRNGSYGAGSGFPSNRGDFGCGDHGRDWAGLGAPAPGRGRLWPARFSCSQGPQWSPGSRAACRAVARSAMRSTLEAGGAAPYP